MLPVEQQKRLFGFFIFLGCIQLIACARNDVSALTELFYSWPDLSFPIWTRFLRRRKGCFLESPDTKSVLGKGIGCVPHGPLRKSARRR